MKPLWTTIGGVLLLATACGGQASRTAPSSGVLTPEMPADELEALFLARTDSARSRFTEADVRFVAGMIGHHAQALEMAGFAPARDASSSIRTLTARLINSQRDEIATLQRWLTDRGQPAPEVRVEGERVIVDASEHAHHGSGMLSADQMSQLEQSKGAEFDRLLLTYMIQHHQGAVAMVRELFATDGAGQDEAVFRIAADIQVDQLTEIARMERMLETL